MLNRQIKISRYTIYDYISHYIFVLAVPIIQNILFSAETLVGAIINNAFLLTVLLLLVFNAVAEYRAKSFYEIGEKLVTKRGFFIRHRQVIPKDRIHAYFLEKNIIQHLSGVYTLYAVAAESSRENRKRRVFLSGDIDISAKKEEITHLFKSGNIKILLLAFSWSNSVAGLIFLSPVISNIGKIFGQQYEELIHSRLDISEFIVAFGIPPLTAYVSGLLTIGFCAALLLQFFRYFNMKSFIKDGKIFVFRGLFHKSVFVTQMDKINSITIKQSVPMMLMKLKCAYVQTIGAGTVKGDKSLVIPAERGMDIEKNVCCLIDCSVIQNTVRAEQKAIPSFINLPVFLLMSCIAAMLWLGITQRLGGGLALCFGVFAIYFLLLIIFRLTARKRTSLQTTNSALVLNYYKKMNLTSTIIEKEKIQSVQITQNIFQRKSGLCNVRVHVFAAKRCCFDVCGLAVTEARQLLHCQKV